MDRYQLYAWYKNCKGTTDIKDNYKLYTHTDDKDSLITVQLMLNVESFIWDSVDKICLDNEIYEANQ